MCTKTNIATFQTTPGYNEYSLFYQQAEMDEDKNPIIIQENTMKEGTNYSSEEREEENFNQIWLHPNVKNADEVRLTGRIEVPGGGQEAILKRDSFASEFMDVFM